MRFRRPTRAGNSRRTGTIAVIALIPVILITGIWLWWGNANPHVKVPTPVMPVPNAYDDYAVAIKALVRVVYIKNAASTEPNGQRVFTLEEKESLVRANAPALSALRRGLRRTFHAHPARSYSVGLPSYAPYRTLAQVLFLEGQVKEARGDYVGALESYLDAMQLGGEIQRGSPLIGRITGYSVQELGRRPTWEIVSHLDGPTARRAAHRLETIESRSFPYAETLREEMWFGQASLTELLWPRYHLKTKLFPGEESENGSANSIATVVFHLYGKRRILNNFTWYMEQSIEQARQPYAARLPDPAVPGDPLSRVALPVFVQARLHDVKAQTRNSLLMVTLALRAYRAEQGRYPKALSELTPQYLKRLPDDPFALNEPPRYRMNGTSYVLYSIGPDGVDDGGRAIEDRAHLKVPKKRYRYGKESRGDVVAGVNIF